MTRTAPEWRPLSDAPAIIGAASIWLSPYHAAVEALDAALQSGQVKVRGSSLSRPLQQPIESYLSGATLNLAYVATNTLGGHRGKDRFDFWNVQIDQTSLTQFVSSFLAPASPAVDGQTSNAKPYTPPSLGAVAWSRWRDKFRIPEIEAEPAPSDEQVADAPRPPRPAPDAEIREQSRAVYRDAIGSGAKPPNINELANRVQANLEGMGLSTSKQHIRTIGSEPEFKAMRLSVGRRHRP